MGGGESWEGNTHEGHTERVLISGVRGRTSEGIGKTHEEEREGEEYEEEREGEEHDEEERWWTNTNERGRVVAKGESAEKESDMRKSGEWMVIDGV